jgi:hypothetical protein
MDFLLPGTTDTLSKTTLQMLTANSEAVAMLEYIAGNEKWTTQETEWPGGAPVSQHSGSRGGRS